MKKLLFFLIFMLGFQPLTFAQFYDDEDVLWFYDYDGGEGANRGLVFNFDGKKGAVLNNPSTRLAIQNNLKRDINYFEKQVFKVNFDLKYVGITNGMTEYVQRKTYSNPWGVTVLVIHYYFSSDRSKLIYKCETDKSPQYYHKVEKSDFLPGRSRHSLNDNDKIYE